MDSNKWNANAHISSTIIHDLNLKITTRFHHHDAFFCFFFSFSSFSFSISATYFSISSGFKIYRRKFMVTPKPHEVPQSSNATFGEGTFGLRPDRASQPLLPENQAGRARARRQPSEPACRRLKAEANPPGCQHLLSVPSEPRLWGSLREPPS